MIMWFGVGPGSKVAMGAISCFFPVALNVAGGMREIDKVLIRVGRSFRANTWQMVTKIYMPAMRHPIINGMRLGLGVCLIGTLLAETKLSNRGVGSPGDRGLHAVRHAADVCAADRAVRDLDRRQCADRPVRRSRRHQAHVTYFVREANDVRCNLDQAGAVAQAADPPRALLRRQMAEAGDRTLCRRDRARLGRVARQGRRRHRRRCRGGDRRRQGRIQGMAPRTAAGTRQDAARHCRRAAQERRRACDARCRRLRQPLCRDGARRRMPARRSSTSMPASSPR